MAAYVRSQVTRHWQAVRRFRRRNHRHAGVTQCRQLRGFGGIHHRADPGDTMKRYRGWPGQRLAGAETRHRRVLRKLRSGPPGCNSLDVAEGDPKFSGQLSLHYKDVIGDDMQAGLPLYITGF